MSLIEIFGGSYLKHEMSAIADIEFFCTPAKSVDISSLRKQLHDCFAWIKAAAAISTRNTAEDGREWS